jgi:hypothetical protein
MCLSTTSFGHWIVAPRLMHVFTAHEEMLPGDLSPMHMPDTSDEAEVLLLCLKLGLYPTGGDGDSASETQLGEPTEADSEG